MDANDLRAFYGEPSLLARNKVLPRLDHHCRDFIARSPFLVLGTADAQGNQDVSPAATRPGSSRSWPTAGWRFPIGPAIAGSIRLANIAVNPKVALLFMVPGFDETVRVNGRASDDPRAGLLSRWRCKGRPAVAAILVEVEEAFFHCAKALMPLGLVGSGRPRATGGRCRPWAGSSPTRSRRRCGRGGRRGRGRATATASTDLAPGWPAGRSAGTCAGAPPRPSRS